jgi:cellulose synthase/poly-beta-1,6-N-acetylglucosamine synthase-like glycosyltransferase
MPVSGAPLVSVVIATYNRPAYLESAIASAVNGDYRNVEIIVADDLGSDVNREIAERFGDPRIVYHRNETNLGMAANHIHAFRHLASGEFIAILNDDDEWEPQFLGKLVPHLADNPDVVLAFSDHYIIDEHGRIDLKATQENTRRWRRDVLSPGLHRPFWRCLVELSIPLAQASVIRRDEIDWSDFPAATGSAYDQWLGYLACRGGKACYYLPERLTRYRAHGGSSTASPGDDGSLGMILMYARLMAMPELAGLRGEIGSRCGATHLSYGLFLMQVGRVREARTHLRDAISLRGLTPRAALAFALASVPDALGVAALRALRRFHRRFQVWKSLKDPPEHK